MRSIPRLDLKGQDLDTIKGLPPNLMKIPSGCPFHPRCPRAQDRCQEQIPEQHLLGDGRTSACHFAEELMTSE